MRRQVDAYAADPSAGASKGQSSIQIRRDWTAKERQLQVRPCCDMQAQQLTGRIFPLGNSIVQADSFTNAELA